MATKVVVMVPGYTGTILNNPTLNNGTGAQVWPLSTDQKSAMLAIYEYYEKLNKTGEEQAIAYLTTNNAIKVLSATYTGLGLGDNNLTTGEVIQSINGTAIYGTLAQIFSGEHFQTYMYGIDTIEAGSDAFIQFPYDWRRTNAYQEDDGFNGSGSAYALNSALSDIHNIFQSDYELYLVGHSMGGLVIRNLLELTGQSETAGTWADYLQWLCTFATPHLGSPTALAAVCTEFDPQGNTINLPAPVEEGIFRALINMDNLPAGYQLLPYFSAGGEWEFISDGTTSYGLGDSAVSSWKQNYGPNAGNLSSAADMFNALNYKDDKRCDYYCLYSTSYDGATSDETIWQFTYGSPGTLTADKASGVGDGFVSPFSGSFGQDTTAGDNGGSNTLPSSEITPKSFSGYSHNDMVARQPSNTDTPDTNPILYLLSLLGLS